MMESRKRPLEDVDGVATKKRLLNSAGNSPLANGGLDSEEPSHLLNVEFFRKEAIFRRMKHYSRECERNQARIRELEDRKNACEAGMAAMTACWTQLLETVRTLPVGQPNNSEPIDSFADDIFDLTLYISEESVPELRAAMERTISSTREILTRIAQLSTPSGLQAEVYQQYQTVQTECASLRSQLNLARSKVRELESHEDELQLALLAAENRVERLQSSTVVSAEAKAEKEEQKIDKNDSPVARPPSPPKPQPNGQSQEPTTPESNIWQTLAAEREKKIRLQEEEITQLQSINASLNLEVSLPSKETVSQSPHYKILVDHVSHVERGASEAREELNKLRTEIAELRVKRPEIEEIFIRDAAKENQELKTLFSKRDAESARLRDQRDQHATELNERKHKDSLKIQSLEQLKELAESRSERIKELHAELKRCKALLAANVADEGVLAYLLGDCPEGTTYVDDLKQRLASAETRADALEKSFSIFNEEHPDVVAHMRTEADVRRELAALKAQLERYQAVFGDASALPQDLQKLEEQLRTKTDEVHRLELLDNQHRETETSLYSELDKLSAAWETLDRRIESKVFDLTALEDRLNRSNIDRAKLETKFYSAMRDKESIEMERKNLSRHSEKQAKAVEHLVETEKNLSAQITSLDREALHHRQVLDAYKTRMEELEAEIDAWKLRTENEKNRVEKIRSDFIKREKEHQRTRTHLRRAEENLAKARRDTEKTEKYSSLGKASTPREADLEEQIQRLWKLVKCSLCKEGMRNTVIMKCMHSFCKECVDARIATRQRKCPHCNQMFAISDVQALYLQ